mgnify:CR=1 FL=1
MIQFAEKLLKEMEQELHLVTMQQERKPAKAKASFDVVDKYISQLKEAIREYEFKDIDEEILFFKEIKPQFHHLLLYYNELAFIESGRPIGDRKLIISYLRKIIERNSEFIERHKILHLYYSLGHTCEDEKWFVRNSEQPSVYPTCTADYDPVFSTQSSTMLSMLLCFEKLNYQLAKEIDIVKAGSEAISTANGDKKTGLLWTDSKAALVELAYALLARGSANYGKADVNQIVQTLEVAFNIQTGNYYRTFTDLSNRKKGRTPFLDSLKEHLERRMDDRL